MALSGILFVTWRLFEIIMLIPPVGMLGWFVHGYVDSNQLTPNFILVLFITSVLALAWAVFTTISYFRARHDAAFIALVDLGFVGALIAGVVVMRGIASADCSNFTSDTFFLTFGPFGYFGVETNSPWAVDVNKNCAVLKTSFAFGIIDIILFATTFWLALLVHRNHRDDDRVVVRREYHSSRRDGRRSGSRDYRGSRDYDYGPGRRSSQRSSSRRNYYV